MSPKVVVATTTDGWTIAVAIGTLIAAGGAVIGLWVATRQAKRARAEHRADLQRQDSLRRLEAISEQYSRYLGASKRYQKFDRQ